MSDENNRRRESTLNEKISQMNAERRSEDFTQPILEKNARRKRLFVIIGVVVLIIIIGVLLFMLLKNNGASGGDSQNGNGSESTEMTLHMPDSVTTTDLAGMVNISVDRIIDIYKEKGVTVSENQMLNRELINMLARELGYAVEYDSDKGGSNSEEDIRMIELQQQLAQSEFENLEKEFSQMEAPISVNIKNDKVKKQLQDQYNKARLEVEELRKQLKDLSNKNSKEIEELNNQIKTLRELIKHYLEQIDELNKENQQLRNENTDLRNQLNQTSNTLQETQREKANLTERMTLAEKLNVTGATMNMLNKKGKTESKVKNAKQFVITFSIPQNVSTPVGTKTIYAVITTPEGQMLEGAGNFTFEGSTLPASASLNVDYGGEEIGGLKMYYDISQALTPGEYTFQLFCDGYQLMKTAQRVSFNK